MALSDHYRPFARQQIFHDSTAKYRLFGGAAGPGKTKALLWEAIFQARFWPGADTLLLRRTYPELESSLLAYFRRDVPRRYYKKYNESKHIVTWPNGSTTRFGYCRNENDVYRYQGAEFLFIGLDELTHFTLKQWQFLTSRNRCPLPGSRPCMAGATNPGNIGHAWVKALWVDHKAPAGFDQAALYNPHDYEFIQARLEDNPIYANDADYRHTLEVLPEHLRRAFLDGDWNVFAGQYFDIFDYGRHTARPEEIRLEPWWPRWISIDWGFQHNSAVYWHCAVPIGGGPSRIVTYREFVQNGLSSRMLGQGIAERSGRENISEVFLSPDAFAHRTAEASIAEQLSEVLAANGFPHPAPADDDRVGGWQFMYQLLESNAWIITENCAKLIECMPTLVRDTARQEDIRKMDGDDPADSARYGLVSGGRIAGVGTAFTPFRAGQSPPLNPPGSGAHFVTGMPLGEQIARRVSATDPTSQAIHFQRLEAEARKQFRPKPLLRRRW
ncbi:MAG TPA: hypothetical protein VMI32_17195 [Candidatus Solibacter sp.]|nr:hypothetical protein [Candidatus Solibacter sp.]